MNEILRLISKFILINLSHLFREGNKRANCPAVYARELMEDDVKQQQMRRITVRVEGDDNVSYKNL